jgi:aminoglycoside phosphotransferase family enzyme/predicted kinase
VAVTDLEQHERLVSAMMDPAAWPAAGADRRRIDTHISTVVLAGDWAYKLKKPLYLGFLDFLSMEAREHACREELRLNRRLAPDLYLDVCRITGAVDHPAVDGDGPLVDWAVRMRRFDPDAVLSQHLDRLDDALVDGLAAEVAAFHGQVDRAAADDVGGPGPACAAMRQNFEQIRQFHPPAAERLQRLEAWTASLCERISPLLQQRHDAGFTRECHGDLHLGNVALIDGRPVVFDAIEFNPALRWIDPINDVAFMTMDLQQRSLDWQARRFVNRYLEVTGDYAGLALLRGFEVYRALVRAKIASIRLGQADLAAADRAAVEREFGGYLDLADRLCRPARPALVLMHGVSGSGKSHAAYALLERLDAVVVRSDVERKRLLGLAAGADATAHGAYRADMTDRTYARLAELAGGLLEAGYSAIVDATFLRAEQRQRFRQLADTQGRPFVIVDCEAPRDVLVQRLAARSDTAGNVSDADVAVLDGQLAAREPLGEDERRACVSVAPGQALDIAGLERLIA